MKKRIAVFSLSFLLAAFVVYALILNQQTEEEDGLWISGTIELIEVDCAFKISGLIEDLRFDEGDFVKEGDLIACLDDRALQDQRRKAEASPSMRKSRVAQLVIAIEHQEKNNEGLIAQAEAQVAASLARLEELMAGARSQEIEDARAALDRAREKGKGN